MNEDNDKKDQYKLSLRRPYPELDLHQQKEKIKLHEINSENYPGFEDPSISNPDTHALRKIPNHFDDQNILRASNKPNIQANKVPHVKLKLISIQETQKEMPQDESCTPTQSDININNYQT